jgi:transcription initiation factor IIE alpha subunit
MDLKNEILINKFGQNLVKIDHLNKEFDTLSLLEKREYLHELIFFILQSKVSNSDIDLAIIKSGLKPTFTPCVLLKKRGVNNNSLLSILNLPDNELNKVLYLFLNLFQIGYEKRYNIEQNNINKWWYWDLSEPNIEDKIYNLYNK